MIFVNKKASYSILYILHDLSYTKITQGKKKIH